MSVRLTRKEYFKVSLYKAISTYLLTSRHFDTIGNVCTHDF